VSFHQCGVKYREVDKDDGLVLFLLVIAVMILAINDLKG